MRAVGFRRIGGPGVLELIELPEPQAGEGEVRIRVHTATVNPTDTGLRSGGRPEALAVASPPYVPGMEAAGVLDQIGEGVTTNLAIGDHVMAVVFPLGAYGAYSEYVVVPATSVARAPTGATDVEAATLPMNGLTACLALDLLSLEAGQTLAITGAAGAVGGYAIQLAKVKGLRVVAGEDSAPADEELIAKLGADVIVARGPDVAERIRAVLPAGVHGLIDAALLNEAVVPAVRDDGLIATLRGYVGPPNRGITFYPVSVRTIGRAYPQLDWLRQQVEDGKLTLRVACAFSAAEADQAHRLLEAGGTRGRIVLLF